MNTEQTARLHIGARIRRLRGAANMTQLQLSEETGLARPNIARIETGNSNATLDTLGRIAAALNARLDIVSAN